MQNSIYTPIPGSMLASTPSTELISCLTKTNKAISHANAAREARAPRDARKVVKMTKNAEDANELNKASRVKAAANSSWQHRARERNGYFFHHQGGGGGSQETMPASGSWRIRIFRMTMMRQEDRRSSY